MPPRIQVLPDTLVNQIAAGEVVERPASVVKELVENCLDAGASEIEVEIRSGGRSLIRVVDNGRGMGRDDLLLSVERHATSKIVSQSDLFRIMTLGFRGEALAAISSVSRMTVNTRTKDDEAGLSLTVTGGKVGQITKIGCPVGTDIEIKDLFFNTPARLKFLKSETLETGHIIDVITRTAMGQAGVAFTLRRGSEALVRASRNSEGRDRLFELLGKRIGRHLYPFSGTKLEMTLSGFFSAPELSRSSWTGFYLFVNGRPLRDRRIMRSVAQAYQGVLPKGRYPVVVLRLGIPPKEVDVNVHPGKLEARFAQPRALADLIISAIEKGLADRPWAPNSSSKMRPSGGLFQGATPGKYPKVAPSQETQSSDRRWVLKRGNASVVGEGPQVKYGEPDAQSLPHPNAPFSDGGPPLPQKSPPERVTSSEEVWTEESVDEFPQSEAGMGSGRRFSRMRVIGQYLSRFLICQEGAKLLLIDRQIALERLFYQGLREDHEEASQRLLIPKVVEIPQNKVGKLIEILPLLQRLGLDVEPFGAESFAIKALPGSIKVQDPGAFFQTIANKASQCKGDDALDQVRRLIARAASGDLKSRLKPSEYVVFMAQMDATNIVIDHTGSGPLLISLSPMEVGRLIQKG